MPDLTYGFLHSKWGLWHQNCKSLWVQALIWGCCMQNSDFWIRNTSLFVSQPSSVILFIQNSDFSIGITSLYGSKPSFVAFACKTATLGPDLQVSMGPRPYQWFFAFKRATLAPEVQVSVSQTLPSALCMQNIVISIRNTSLYGYQPSFVVFAFKTSTLGPEL